MIENQQDKDQYLEQGKSRVDETEIDLLDILRKILGLRKILYKAAGIGLVIGIVVALSVPKQYTVKVTLSPEMGSSKGGNGLAGLAASFLGSGATGSEGSDALNASLSADIVSSTPFLLELLDIQVPVSEKDGEETFLSYLDKQKFPWWSYVIKVPSMIVGGVKVLFSAEKEGDIDKSSHQRVIELSKEEYSKINYLKENITAVIDKKTFITAVSVTLQNPKTAAVVADSVVRKLQKYIIVYRTTKAKEDCLYLEELFKERQQEYYTAQKKYANYVDSHDNLIFQSVRVEQERLQNDLGLAYQVYSQVANQLQVARAKVQEEKPIFAIVEPSIVPLYPSGISGKVYVALFVFISVFCALGWWLLGKNLLNTLRNEI